MTTTNAAASGSVPERHPFGGIIYLCPDCTGTLTQDGITWECSQPHPEREAQTRTAEVDEQIRTRIQFLLQQGKSTAEIIVLIWQVQPGASQRYQALQHIIAETDVSNK